MTVQNLTTTAIQVVEARDMVREFAVSGAEFDGCDTLYLRYSAEGEAEMGIMRRGTSITQITIPRLKPLWAWANDGVCKLVLKRLDI